MDIEWKRVQSIARRMVAGVLFVLLLFGASATVFSAAAAGINALSTMDTGGSATIVGSVESTVLPSTSAMAMSTGGDAASVAQNSGSGSLLSLPSSTTSSSLGSGSLGFTDRLNYSIDHMHSPVSGAMDRGGIVLGNHISHSFGRFLSNVLRFLFVEQSDGNSASSSTSSTQTGGIQSLPGGGQ